MKKVPKLRFPEFSKEWKEKKLDDVTKITDGVHFTPNYVEQGIPFWSVETIVSGAEPKYITKEAHEKAKKRCFPQKDDILLTRIGTLAKARLIDWDDEFSIYVSVALIKKSNFFDSAFIRYYFETEQYQRDFFSKSLLTATPKKINMEDLKETKIKLPSILEQQKISQIFTMIDKKIQKQQEKVNAFKEYKKGMMQKLFSQEIRFRDENEEEYPEWEKRRFGEIFYEPNKEKIENPHERQLLTVKLHCKGIESTGKCPNKTESGRPYFQRFKGELLIGRQNFHNGGIGIVSDKCDGLIASNAISSYVHNEGMNLYFIYYQMSQTDFYKRIDLLIGGTGQKEISKAELEKIYLLVPVKSEQDKIADIITSLQKKVLYEGEKLKQLNKWKKGLLQQMFV